MTYGNVNVETVTTSTAGGILGAGNASIMKNRIINGAMVIDQRNAGASGTTAGYTIDRWSMSSNLSTKGTWQQNAGSVTPPVGFVNYLGFTSNSAYSIASGDFFSFFQPIEGYNIADLQWGTANAKTVTLSFWVRSSLTGTFGGSLVNNGSTRSYPFTYTISSANTWTQASVTIAGDTSGTWLTTNGFGIGVSLAFGVGTTYSGTAGAWAGANYLSATGATSVVGTNGATFYITGVQLEVGSSATGYEYRQYGQELQLCQRYYQVGEGFTAGYAAGSTTMGGMATLSPTMRAAPSTVVVASSGAPPGANFSGSPSAGTTTTTYIPVTWGTNGLTANAYGLFSFTASAEL